MNYDFLDPAFMESSRKAVQTFQIYLEQVEPPPRELDELCTRLRTYGHCDSLASDFLVGAVDGSGDFPVFQQDDIFVYLVTSAALLYQTQTDRQHKLSRVLVEGEHLKHFVVLPGNPKLLRQEYKNYINFLAGTSLQNLVVESDYLEVYGRFGKKISSSHVRWDKLAIPHASQVASHQYQIRSLAELATVLRFLHSKPKYVLIDTSFVYFLLGNTLFLPEIMKRYIKARALEQGTGLIALSKSHNVPNGDLIGRKAKELGFTDHWYLRLPSKELGEELPSFLHEREIPPKLCVSYLFKFHGTTFPMRIDLDFRWWHQAIGENEEAEKAFFRELDYTCHDVRSYGYPYPMYAAHRRASLTKGERKSIREILVRHAMHEGLIREPFERAGEDLHMGGM